MMSGVRIGNKPPDVWECFECNRNLRTHEEIVSCPFCASEEVYKVV